MSTTVARAPCPTTVTTCLESLRDIPNTSTSTIDGINNNNNKWCKINLSAGFLQVSGSASEPDPPPNAPTGPRNPRPGPRPGPRLAGASAQGDIALHISDTEENSNGHIMLPRPGGGGGHNGGGPSGEPKPKPKPNPEPSSSSKQVKGSLNAIPWMSSLVLVSCMLAGTTSAQELLQSVPIASRSNERSAKELDDIWTSMIKNDQPAVKAMMAPASNPHILVRADVPKEHGPSHIPVTDNTILFFLGSLGFFLTAVMWNLYVRYGWDRDGAMKIDATARRAMGRASSPIFGGRRPISPAGSIGRRAAMRARSPPSGRGRLSPPRRRSPPPPRRELEDNKSKKVGFGDIPLEALKPKGGDKVKRGEARLSVAARGVASQLTAGQMRKLWMR
ncbi:hypothetical protein ABEF95_005965 [Exophiala dermatitidis]